MEILFSPRQSPPIAVTHKRSHLDKALLHTQEYQCSAAQANHQFADAEVIGTHQVH
jgi:hypothetical protein